MVWAQDDVLNAFLLMDQRNIVNLILFWKSGLDMRPDHCILFISDPFLLLKELALNSDLHCLYNV